MKPRILVSMDYLPDQGYLLRADLNERLETLGAEIIPLKYNLDELRRQLQKADGILLPGSRFDLQPESYGEKAKFDSVLVNPVREKFEFSLLEEIRSLDIPVLGICWGFQLINVFYGGSLYQHLPDEFPSKIQHEQKTPSTQPSHSVRFLDLSRSKKIFGVEELQVNSTHHQGIKTLAKNLKKEAESPDTLIEAFSFPEKNFFWGVEWHPERLQDDPIIPSFLAACRR